MKAKNNSWTTPLTIFIISVFIIGICFNLVETRYKKEIKELKSINENLEQEVLSRDIQLSEYELAIQYLDSTCSKQMDSILLNLE